MKHFDRYAGFSLVLVLACVLGLSACSPQGGGGTSAEPGSMTTTRSDATPLVYTVNYPLAYFARVIGGDAVEVRFPAGPDADPAWWKPDDAVIAEYQKADLILLNGSGFARWVEKASLPQAKLLNTSAGFEERYIEIDEGVVHAHGPEGKHAHKGLAGNTWLDAEQAKLQAAAIAEAFADLRPDKKAMFAENLAGLGEELEELDQALAHEFRRIEGRPLLASHPVYQYMARHYVLNLDSLHWEPFEVPAEEEWVNLDALLETHPARIILWEAPPKAETVAALAKRNITPAVFHTAANQLGQESYMDTMQKNLRRLRKAIDSVTSP